VSKLWTKLIIAAFGALALLLPPETALAATCEVKNNAPPFISHDLTNSNCELCGYGYVTIVIANSSQPGLAPSISGDYPTLTFTSAQIPAHGLLETRQGNNQSNTLNAVAANNVVLLGGTPYLLASDNILDFIVNGDFTTGTSKCSWGDTYERYANTSVYLGGKI
jgi:hypothetical protein